MVTLSDLKDLLWFENISPHNEPLFPLLGFGMLSIKQLGILGSGIMLAWGIWQKTGDYLAIIPAVIVLILYAYSRILCSGTYLIHDSRCIHSCSRNYYAYQYSCSQNLTSRSSFFEAILYIHYNEKFVLNKKVIFYYMDLIIWKKFNIQITLIAIMLVPLWILVRSDHLILFMIFLSAIIVILMSLYSKPIYNWIYRKKIHMKIFTHLYSNIPTENIWCLHYKK